ncbi:MAG: alpha/beta fold hydrolase [Paracoccaceae bacterium]
MLHRIVTGSPSALPPLLIVHGLFGSARNWGAIARRMSEDRQVITVDMRNHGASPHLPSHSYADLADDLAETIRDLGIIPDIVGHSMGGKAAMLLALREPALLRRLVVADIAPVAYSHSQSHLIDAMRNLDLTGIARRSQADARLAADIESSQVRAFLLQSLDLDAGKWLLNLDVLDAAMADITGWPEVSGQFDGPVLFLSGGESDYVKSGHRPAIKALFPQAKFARLPGTGHWLHAEKPQEFVATLRVFLG